MSAALIETEGLGVSLGGSRILRDVSIRVARGEIVTIVGPNGSGKTTLVRLVIGALRPTEGAVRRAPGLVIGYVPQRLAIDHTMPLSVARFLAFASRDRAARTRALAHVGAPGLERRQMIDLSGGQFQRVMLAHALLRRPDLLVLDEAAQGLDQPGTAAFYRLVETLRAELGCAVLMVSHDLHVVMAASDRVICLNGHVCCEGAPMHVSAAPEYRALFGHGTGGTMALYRHEHDHAHGDGDHAHHHPRAPEEAEEEA
ncbi:ATP-binding cassette domain-containing protein [Amaricoccus solimangrovi]|uniref:Metal ABC transporter ATP-binding protein n=1 Tax=Amaricoccus solimangrovi TaxID=2589815 RepID=A0A501WYY7_9RHOB|nr:metal ABC transporter ATP-binding protein [Amaricoccus solimangrovi]TPE53910.1 metal ABC transporter ATP-binding protein [Amaricoccus solimangrovi]